MDNFLLISNYLKRYKKLFSNEIFIPQQVTFKNKQDDFINGKDVLIPYECIINNCKKCQYSSLKINDFFFGFGDPHAHLLIIDEAPAFKIDSQGVQILGKADKLLDKILLAIGLSRTKNTFIVKLLFAREISKQFQHKFP